MRRGFPVGRCAATAISTVIGVILGLIAGYFGGAADMIIMRFTDMVMSFPLYFAGAGCGVDF